MFTGPFDVSIIKRALIKKNVSLHFIQMRDFAYDKHKSVDDRPFGGGQGMILRVDIVDRAIHYAIKHSRIPRSKTRIILTDPKGEVYTQNTARTLSAFSHLIIVCGHYEGVDARVSTFVDQSISIGDYILTGGEIPAMVFVDSIVRLLPETLKQKNATIDESFTDASSLEYDQYTRPQTYKKYSVPPVLLHGNHKDIDAWRNSEKKRITKMNRPDLSTP
jgi:tRNA (guanine37-N1)-methyltransferase